MNRNRPTALYARTATVLGIGYPELMVLYALVVGGQLMIWWSAVIARIMTSLLAVVLTRQRGHK